MNICTLQDNARLIAFARRVISTRFIEDETVNDSDIINNRIYYENGQEEPDSMTADKIYLYASPEPVNTDIGLLIDCKHVAWSDKSRFQLNRADGRVRVWRQPHESMDPTYQQGTVQAGGGSAMVWGVGSWHDMEPLIRLDTTLTGT
ncbi:uncharacterized protein TNCV_3274631 [Trichonephila clavipes]|nr:uncharacterized protein TNCV_3274631 [Trichonephila clavipes]